MQDAHTIQDIQVCVMFLSTLHMKININKQVSLEVNYGINTES